MCVCVCVLGLSLGFGFGFVGFRTQNAISQQTISACTYLLPYNFIIIELYFVIDGGSAGEGNGVNGVDDVR